MGTYFRWFDPLDPGNLREEVLTGFALTFTVELAVILVLFALRRRNHASARNRMVPTLPSWPWSFPLLVWAVDATRRTIHFLDMLAYSHGPAPQQYAVVAFYSLLALALLLGVQTICALVIDPKGPPLGVNRQQRSAVTFALLAPILDGFFLLTIVHWPLPGMS